jgi:hypothetical protein
VACGYIDGSYWHRGKIFNEELFTTDELFKKVMLVFNSPLQRKVVTKLGICCFDLVKANSVQESHAWEEKEVIDRIAFGGVNELE